jgi:hypothetical protein
MVLTPNAGTVEMNKASFTPIRIMLDTSALRRDPRLKGGGFEALARLAEAGYVQIYIPDIVAREFGSAPLNVADTFAETRKALAKLRHYVPEDAQARVSAFESDLVADFKTIQETVASRFGHWVKRTGAQIIPVADQHGRKVLDRYFSGEVPFRTAKARQDLPDAFVLEAIMDLAQDGPLLALISDKLLSRAAAQNEKVTVYTDAKSLIESDGFADLRNKILVQYELENVNHLVRAFLQQQGHFNAQVVDDIIDDVAGRLIPSRQRWWRGIEEDEEAYVESADVVKWAVDGEKMEYLGEGVVSLPLEACLEVNLDHSVNLPFPDNLDAPSSEECMHVSGSLSLILEQDCLRRLPVEGIGASLLEMATVQLDYIDDIEIEWKEY